jgi:hypothetical protein
MLVTAQEAGNAQAAGPPTGGAPSTGTAATAPGGFTPTGAGAGAPPASGGTGAWGSPIGANSGQAGQSGQGAGWGMPSAGAQPAASASGASLHLINSNLGLDLDIQPQTMIGRKVGQFAPIFSQHSSVSSRHLQFTVDPSGNWYVTDLGSTNGTFLGEQQLPPHQPVPLSDGNFLTIANIEFFVQITGVSEDDAEGGTMRL